MPRQFRGSALRVRRRWLPLRPSAPRRLLHPTRPPLDRTAAPHASHLSGNLPAGLDQLCALDSRFHVYRRTLFAAAAAGDRDANTADVNQQLDSAIAGFCAVLSSYFLLAPAFKALEWLVRKYRCASLVAHRAARRLLRMTCMLLPRLVAWLPLCCTAPPHAACLGPGQ